MLVPRQLPVLFNGTAIKGSARICTARPRSLVTLFEHSVPEPNPGFPPLNTNFAPNKPAQELLLLITAQGVKAVWREVGCWHRAAPTLWDTEPLAASIEQQTPGTGSPTNGETMKKGTKNPP